MLQRFLFVLVFSIAAVFTAAPAFALGGQVSVNAVVSQQRLVYIKSGQIIKIEGNASGNFTPTFVDSASGAPAGPTQEINDQYTRLYYHFGDFLAGQVYYPPASVTPSTDPFKSSLSKLEFD